MTAETLGADEPVINDSVVDDSLGAGFESNARFDADLRFEARESEGEFERTEPPNKVFRGSEEEQLQPANTDVDLASERDSYLGALQRLQADFENYRKRVQRQQQEQADRAALDLVNKLLPVLDTLDLACAHLTHKVSAEDNRENKTNSEEEGKALSQARSLLLDTLKREGLERVDEEGAEFDPVVHDAVAHSLVENDESGNDLNASQGGPENPVTTVEEVLRSGYRWRGQVIRPAMVRVRG